MNFWLVLYEDRGWRSLRPLTDLMPVPALAFGGSHLADRWRRAVERARPGSRLLAIEARALVMGAWSEALPAPGSQLEAKDEVIVLNAAALPGDWLNEALESRSPALWRAGDRNAGARLPFDRISPGLGKGAEFEDFLARLNLPSVPVEASFLAWPWDFIESNVAALSADLAEMDREMRGDLDRRAAVLEPERVSLGPGARVDPFAVLDARHGPIRIELGALVASHTLVTGPCRIGPETQLLGGSVGYSSIGPGCRIAGEVDSTVWQGQANKRHQGFVGHSVIGEWVNLGAMTTTSDLKNNYGPVRVWVDGREVESGLRKVGSFLGAHVRTGIGTLLPTGAAVGVGSNLFGGGRFAPKNVPAFSWWDGECLREHRLDKFLETTRIAMNRRDLELGAADEAAIRQLFEATAAERRTAGAAVG